MRGGTAIWPIIVFIASCSNRTSVPKDILQPDSMRNVMKDVMIADAYSFIYVVKDTTKRDKTKAAQDLLEAVFKIHHISRETFQKSLQFYEARPDLSKMMFDSLSSYATTHRNELYRPTANTVTVPRPAVLTGVKPNLKSQGAIPVKPGTKSHSVQLK